MALNLEPRQELSVEAIEREARYWEKVANRERQSADNNHCAINGTAEIHRRNAERAEMNADLLRELINLKNR